MNNLNLSYPSVLKKYKDFLSEGLVGLEKENLRVESKKISSLKHPENLGSALSSKHITTDFSEALTEFITEPSTKEDVFNFLDDLHYFTYHNIDGESLWPLSYPPNILDPEKIAIAEYGESNVGKLKSAYRAGLANRYGKQMQIIAGIHFNYSFPEVFWSEIKSLNDLSIRGLKEEVYFGGLRNIQRFNWLILYLLGASPVIPKSFFNKPPEGLKEKNDYYFSDYSTSLRMSEYGYQNKNQRRLHVSYDSLSDYSRDLIELTRLESIEFKNIPINLNEKIQQISHAYLQIEDEYYSFARPKSSLTSDERTIKKLNSSGVDYIEYRAIDLNPFSRVGIDIRDIDFLEIFIIYCLLTESPKLDKNESKQIYKNSSIISFNGREKDLKIINKDQKTHMKDWANKLLDDMYPIAEILGIDSEVLDKKKDCLTHPEKTLSGKMMQILWEEDLDHDDFGQYFNKKYLEEYRLENRRDKKNYEFIKRSAKRSHTDTLNIEKADKLDFEEYLNEYFSS